MDGKKPLFSADAAEEYFSTLLTYYRNTGNDIFKRDNEGRHVSDQIYSAEYQKYLGMQIAMREVLEYFAKFELGDTAIRQQETVTNRNGLNEPTNADRINAMTIKEKAEFLSSIAYGRETPWSYCFVETFCKECTTVHGTYESGVEDDFHECDFVDGKCPHGSDIVWWLQQPAEEDDHDERKENENA